MLASSIYYLNRQTRSLSPLNKGLAAMGLLLAIQYTFNFIAYYELFPKVFGKDPNGIIKNQIFLVPGLLALTLSFYFGGKQGLKDLFAPYKVWRIHPAMWLGTILIMFPLVYVALMLSDVLLARDIQFRDFIWVGWDYFIKYTPLFLAVAISDELFWIGLVLPLLVKGGLSPLKAAFLMGFCWGLDYVPYIFTGFFVAPGSLASVQMLGTFSLTSWYVWLYYKTGSALIIVVFATVVQFSQNMLPMLPQDNGGSNFESVTVLLSAFAVGMLIWWRFPPVQHSKSQKANAQTTGSQ